MKNRYLSSFLLVVIGFMLPFSSFAQTCNEWSIYLSNNTSNGSTIYRVDLNEDAATAELTALKSLSYPVHIAFDQTASLLYLVNAQNGSFRTLDASVVDGALGDVVTLPQPLSGAVAAAINDEGKLLIGGEQEAKVFIIDKENGARTFFADAQIHGGDIAFDFDQNLYLATRTGGRLKLVIPGFDNMVIGSVPTGVTGMTLMQNGNFIVSSNGNTSLITRTTDGADAGVSYALSLNGQPFTLANGDMASGCTAFQPSIEPCQNHKIYYANHFGSNPSTIYSVELAGGEAHLSPIFQLDYITHIAYNEQSNLLYFTNEISTFVDIFDVATASITGRVHYSPAIGGSLTASVFNPADGLLYVGRSGQVRAVDLSDGTHTLVANAPVSGGDLVLRNGELFLVTNASGGKLFKIEGGSAIEVANLPAGQVNGAALTADSEIFLAGQNGTAFRQIDLAGNVVASFPTKADGAPFTLGFGDLASGCFSGGIDIPPTGCQNLVTYLYNFAGGANSGQLFSVAFEAGNAIYTQISGISAADQHIAISADGLIYAVRGNRIDIFDPTTAAYVQQNITIKNASGQILSGFPAAVIDGEGTLWIARSGDNKVYSVEIIGNEALATEVFGPADGIQVSGGDLVVTEGESGEILWLANRSQARLYNLTEGGFIDMPLPEVKGVSIAADGESLILADGQTDENGGLYLWNPTTDALTKFNNINGPANFFWGDLAGRCFDADDDDEEEEILEECYAATVLQYNPQGNIAANRKDPSKALGEPQRNNTINFVTLGFGGSLILGLDGAAIALPDVDDLEVIETSFGNVNCNNYEERANVYVSQQVVSDPSEIDHTLFQFVGESCTKGDFFDVYAATGFEYFTLVKFEDVSPVFPNRDGYDVDGIVALNGCIVPTQPTPNTASQSLVDPTLRAFPNPSIGQVTITFTNPDEEVVSVEVLDMSGRVVASLFRQVTNIGQEYRVDFNGHALPNGVYITRMSSNSRVVIEKIMIAR